MRDLNTIEVRPFSQFLYTDNVVCGHWHLSLGKNIREYIEVLARKL